MKSKTPFFVLIAALTLMAGCQFQVPSGHVGIIYDDYGNEKGIQAKAYTPGSWGINTLTQSSVLYPTFIQQAQFKAEKDRDDSITFSTSDGNSATTEIAVQAATDAEHAPILFQTYREQFDEILSNQVHLRLRDYFNQFGAKYTVSDIYGEKRNTLLDEVTKALTAEWEKEGMLIKTVSYISRPHFSPTIEAAIELKVKTEQDTLQKQNQVAQTVAEASIQVAKARGEADSNIILAKSISPEILRLKELQNQEKFIDALAAGRASMPSTYVTSATQTLLPLK